MFSTSNPEQLLTGFFIVIPQLRRRQAVGGVCEMTLVLVDNLV